MIRYIGINGTILFPGRSDGFARVTRETIKELLLKKTPIKILSNCRETYSQSSTIHVPKVLSQTNLLGNMSRLLWHQIYLPQILKKNRIDLYYSPTHDGMLNPVCHQVTTIYDLIPLHYPEDSPRFKYYYRYVVPRLIKSSSCAIAGSISTKNDIERLFSINNNVRVIYPGYNKLAFKLQDENIIEKIKNQYHIKDYLLCAGEIRPYKNIKRLIEAFSLLKDASLQLVIVGRITKLSQDIGPFVMNSCKKDNIKLLGYVPDHDLAALYAGAKAFVFPSLYEGFGLPPLEAMACGCPVVVSSTSSLPEVCGDAGLYFDPYQPESIASAISNLLDNSALRADMSAKGLVQASKFSFKRTAEELMLVFGKVSGYNF
jgi:glycosyltransferase involved in cell wall biosynthesis